MDICSILKGAGIGAIIGAGIGAGIGVYIQFRKKKKAEKEAAEEKLKEITEYKEAAAKYDTLTVVEDENEVNEFISNSFNFEPVEATSDPSAIAAGFSMIGRHTSATPVNVESEEHYDCEDLGELEMEIPPENNYEFDSEDPFEIDYQTFDMTCRQFDKIDVTYYDGDGEFVFNYIGKDETVDYPDDSFGPHVLDLFRNEQGQIVKRKIWIRNPWERTDYEITYNTDSYNYETYEDIPGGID